MWFKKTRPMSEYEKEAARKRQFCATVMEKVHTIPSGQWQKDDRSYDTERETQFGKQKDRHRVIEYVAISNGVKVCLSANKGPSEWLYHLKLDGDLVDYYGYTFQDEGIRGGKRERASERPLWSSRKSSRKIGVRKSKACA